MEILHNLYQQR